MSDVPEIHTEDLVSAAQFAELWWSEDLPKKDRNSDAYRKDLENKQAQMRMLRRTKGDYPESSRGRRSSSDLRARMFTLGDFVDWHDSDQPPSVKEEKLAVRAASVHPMWHLERAQDAAAAALGTRETRQLSLAAVVAWLVPMTDKEGITNYLDWAISRDGTAVVDLRKADALVAADVHRLQGVLSALLAGVKDSEAITDRLLRVVRFVLATGEDPSRVVSSALGRLEVPTWDAHLSVRSSESLNRLVASAAHPKVGDKVLDLAAGEGGLLLALAAEAKGAIDLIGYEPDPDAWSITSARCFVAGVEATVLREKTLGSAKELPKADIVVVDPPHKSRKDFPLWLTMARRCLAPDGRAVVVLPSVSMDSGSRSWKLVQGELADAVLLTPSRLRRDSGGKLALWVLGLQSPEKVLLVDASKVGRVRSGTTVISDSELHEIGKMLSSRRHSEDIPESPTVTWDLVDRSDAEDREVDLLAGTRLVDPDELKEASLLIAHLQELSKGTLRRAFSSSDQNALEQLEVKIQNLAKEQRTEGLVIGEEDPPGDGGLEG